MVAKTLETSTAEERGDWGVMQEKIRDRPEALPQQADPTPSADHAGDFGSVTNRCLLSRQANVLQTTLSLSGC